MHVVLEGLKGPAIIRSDTQIRGLAAGDVTVASGCRLDLDGELRGNLMVCAGAIAVINGLVRGTVFNQGGDVRLGRGALGRLREFGPRYA